MSDAAAGRRAPAGLLVAGLLAAVALAIAGATRPPKSPPRMPPTPTMPKMRLASRVVST